MSLFPIFLKLEGRLVVVVGGGNIAEQKLPGVIRTGARVRLVSPSITPQIAAWVHSREIAWLPKEFDAEDLASAFLVIAATSNAKLNGEVFHAADERGIMCNAVDDIEHCHFYSGAVVQRGDLQIAISTNGKSPALAQRLRKELELQFGPEYEVWLQWLGAARESLRASAASSDASRQLLHELASRPVFEDFVRHAISKQSGTGTA